MSNQTEVRLGRQSVGLENRMRLQNPLLLTDPTITGTPNDGLVLTGNPGTYREGAWINELTFPSDFTNPVWVADGWLVQANQAVAPDGTLTADKIIGNPSGTLTRAKIADAATLTFTIHAKAGTYGLGANPFVVGIRNGTTAINLLFIAVDLSLTSDGSGEGWQTKYLGHGWHRITLQVTTGVTIGDNMLYYWGSGGGGFSGGYAYVWEASLKSDEGSIHSEEFQWYLGGLPIEGETANTLTLITAWVGQFVKCRIRVRYADTWYSWFTEPVLIEA